VNIGGGVSEACVLAVNGIVVWNSVRVGGIKTDEAVAAYIRRKYNLLVGDQTAEAIKIQIGSALPLDEELRMEVRGRDQVSGLPKTITISSSEVTEALVDPLAAIAATARAVLEKTPPELAADIIDRGIVMTGGGSLLRNIDRFLTGETGVPCHVAEDPLACVAKGAGKALEQYNVLKRSLPSL
jgi:rod shape-determining protein MreB